MDQRNTKILFSAILSLLMGEASAMGMFLEDGMASRMLRPYERSHVKDS